MGKTAAEIVAEARKRNASAETTTTPVAEPPTAPIGDIPDAIRPIVEAIRPYVTPQINPERIRALVDDAILRLLPKPLKIEFKDAKGEMGKIETAHKQLPKLVELLRRQPYMKRGVMAVGPAGSAKTTAFEQAAEILGIPCYIIPLGPQSSKSDLVGFVDAHGKPVWTAAREAFTNGGLLAFDEVDAANAGVFTCMNSMLAQSSYRWPDGTKTDRHPDFRFGAAANTYGTGGNLQYVGRNTLDAASLDRFRVILWDYDTELEKALAINAACALPDAHEAAAGMAVKWVARVQALRKAAEKAAVRIVISPRACISGAVCLAAGDSWEETENAEIWRDGGISRDDRERILSHV